MQETGKRPTAGTSEPQNPHPRPIPVPWFEGPFRLSPSTVLSCITRPAAPTKGTRHQPRSMAAGPPGKYGTPAIGAVRRAPNARTGLVQGEAAGRVKIGHELVCGRARACRRAVHGTTGIPKSWSRPRPTVRIGSTAITMGTASTHETALPARGTRAFRLPRLPPHPPRHRPPRTHPSSAHKISYANRRRRPSKIVREGSQQNRPDHTYHRAPSVRERQKNGPACIGESVARANAPRSTSKRPSAADHVGVTPLAIDDLETIGSTR